VTIISFSSYVVRREFAQGLPLYCAAAGALLSLGQRFHRDQSIFSLHNVTDNEQFVTRGEINLIDTDV